MLLIFNAWLLLERRDENAASPFQAVIVSLRILDFALIVSAGAGLASLGFGGGGILGNLIDIAMIKTLNSASTSLILITLFLIGVTLFTGLSWAHSSEQVGSMALAAGRWLLTKMKSNKKPAIATAVSKPIAAAPIKIEPVAPVKSKPKPAAEPKKFLKTCARRHGIHNPADPIPNRLY